MHLDKKLSIVNEFTGPERFADIRKHVKLEWVEKALDATGTATVRRRRLPAEQVVWLVIGMAMFRKWPIHDLVGRLSLVLPGPKPTVVPSAVADARSRLGAEPMEHLFTMTASKWSRRSADEHRWRGLALYGVDGTSLRVADSEENVLQYGRPQSHRGEGGYPQARLVTVMALRSHLIAAASFGPYAISEMAMASDLWRSIPDDSLTIVDRNYLAGGVLVPLAAGGRNRHWLLRARSDTKMTVIERLSKHEAIVELSISPQSRAKDENLPRTYRARAISYQMTGYDEQILLTSLLDAEAHPAREVVALYHERWELEMAYDEMKTVMLDREETIRSRTAKGVEQEIWGILLAYNLVRLEMERTAERHDVAPTQISFVTSMRIICDTWKWCAVASPGALPKRLKTMEEFMTRLVLPERRRERAYPRAVKIKMSAYPRKRPVKPVK
jgi:hypothetical protein